MKNSNFIWGLAVGAGIVFVAFYWGNLADLGDWGVCVTKGDNAETTMLCLRSWASSLSGWVAAIVAALVGYFSLGPLVQQTKIDRAKNKTDALMKEIEILEQLKAEIHALQVTYHGVLFTLVPIPTGVDRDGFLKVGPRFEEEVWVQDRRREKALFLLDFRKIIMNFRMKSSDFSEVDDAKIKEQFSYDDEIEAIEANMTKLILSSEVPNEQGEVYFEEVGARIDALVIKVLKSELRLKYASEVRKRRIIRLLPNIRSKVYE